MKYDKDTTDRLREAYDILNEICERYPYADCDECSLNRPMYDVQGHPTRPKFCLLKLLGEARDDAYAKNEEKP